MPSIEKNILAIDSSTSTLRVGLLDAAGRIHESENHDRFRHAEFIFTLIEDVLNQAGLNKNQIEGIVIVSGPGSFTGLRVGMAAAKALALSLGIPLAGLSIYSAIAERLFREHGRAAVLIPSRRDEYYIGKIESPEFDDSRISMITKDQLNDTSDLPPILAIDFDINKLKLSNGQALIGDAFGMTIEDLITAGRPLLKNVNSDDVARMEPLYIQDFKPGVKNG